MIPKPILVGIVALIATAGCRPATEPSHAVRVSVGGAATPIKDLSYERFFEQTVDDACRVTTARAAPNLAIAGPVGSVVDVDVDVDACRSGDETPPDFSCSWTVTPRPGVCAPRGTGADGGGGPTPGSDGSHRGSLQIPSRTGIYDAVLSCTLDDGGTLFEPIESTIYATYREPLFMVSPPEQEWYARATDWGCGFTARADEKDVLKQVLNAQYSYGRDHWRYGSFDAPTETSYAPYNEGNWLNCPWQALVDEGNPCNFADCFEFSQVFEHMSATLGIGGFEPIADVGNASEGFRTVAGSFSLDPRFPGNIDCTEDGRCDGYLFTSHSLRKRDDVYYDATFNKIYDAADAFIDASVDQWADGQVTLAETGVKLKSSGRGYGSWSQWTTPGGQLVSLQFPPPPPTRGSGAAVDARVTRTMLGILISATVEIANDGEYVVRALLARAGSTTGEAPDWKPMRSHGSPAFSDRYVAGAGTKQLAFSFGYPAIESIGGPGSHTYRIEVFEHTTPGDELSAAAPRLVGDFEQSIEITRAQLDGAKGADILDIEIGEVVPAGPDGEPGHFVVHYTLSIPPAVGQTDAQGDPFGPPISSYTLQARLAGYETFESLAYAGERYDIDEGTRTVTLTVPLPPAGNVRDDGSASGATANDAPATEHLELTTELIANRAGYWWEYAVAFRRFSLDFTDGAVQRVELRSLLDRRTP